MTRSSVLGFDRKLELDWLDAAAANVAQNATKDELRAFLHTYLDALAFAEEAPGSARAKTARVIMRIWGNPGPDLRILHNRAISLLAAVDPRERLSIHWALTIAAYPFFSDHADAIGRLLLLQETVSTSQIHRRIMGIWGERSTVSRTSRHVVRTMIGWGVLEDAGKGLYRRSNIQRPVSGKVAELLVQAALITDNRAAIPIAQAATNPRLFPFQVVLNVSELRRSKDLQVFREGLEQEFVTGVR